MSRRPDVTVPSPCLPPEQAEQIRAELERVLSNHLFRGSRRCQSLLRYITEQTLAGNTHALKERTLGVEVFDRPPDYDTSQEPVVRATASEIRKKLAQYYQENGGHSEIRIDLLPGSYVAEFHPVTVPEPVQEPRRASVIGLSLALAALAAVVLCAALLSHYQGSALDTFWSPVLRAPGTVLICVGQPIAYNLVSASAQDKLQKKEDSADPQLAGSDNGAIPRKDLIVLRDRYVALGDAICLARLASVFEGHRKAYRIRGEQSTSYADLKESPAVLIAAFDNQWTLQAAGQLRFTFEKDSAHDIDMVRDRAHPENKQWKLIGAWPHWNVTDDYAIVSLIRRDVNTDRPFVIAAGITEYGTMAAGDFLSNPQYFADALPILPRDWRTKNLQMVLHVPILHRTPGRPRVIAAHAW